MTKLCVPQPIRVLVVEDHRVVAQGLKALLEDEQDMQVVGMAGSVDEAATLAEGVQPDVAVLDYRLSDGTGAQAADTIRRRHPQTAMLFLSHDESSIARVASVEAGASGYLLKSQAADDLVDAIRRVVAGQVLFSSQHLRELLIWHREHLIAVDELTHREREVLVLVAEGLDNHEIARQLGVSYGTVRSHIRSLVAKLEVHSKGAAVAKATRLGILER
jgi:DNA-binding NarL/FixJ family response regulator